MTIYRYDRTVTTRNAQTIAGGRRMDRKDDQDYGPANNSKRRTLRTHRTGR